MSFGIYQGQGEGALGRLAFTLGADGIQQLEADMARAEGIINKFERTQKDVSKKVTQYQKEITDGAKKQAADIDSALNRMRKANEGLLSQKEVNTKWAKEIEGIRSTITEVQRLKVAESDRVVAAATATNRWTEATKQAATKQVEIVKAAADTNVSTWSRMWTRFKVASYPAQAEFLEMMNRMSSGVKGFSGQAIFRGVMSGLGIGSAMAMVSAAIGAVTDKMGESTRAAKEAADAWNDYEKSLRNTMKTAAEMSIGGQTLEQQVRSRNLLVEQAEKAMKKAAEEQDKLEKERQNPAQFARGFGFVSEAFANNAAKIASLTPFKALRDAADQQVKEIEAKQARMKDLGIEAMSNDDTVTNKLSANIAKQKKEVDALTLAHKQALQARDEAQRALDISRGLIPTVETDLQRQNRLREEARIETQRLNDALEVQIKMEEEAEVRIKNWHDSLRASATTMQGMLDPAVAFKQEMFEISILAQTIDQRTGKTFITAQQAAELASRARDRRDANQLAIAQNTPESQAGRERQGRIDRFVGMTQLENPGIAGDIERLDGMKAQLDEEMNILEEHMEADEDLRRRHAEKVAEIERQKNGLILQEAAATAGMLADVTALAFGEQSGAFKAMFAISKAFAIAEATIAMQTAIARALAHPAGFPANIGLIAQAAALGTSIISNMQSIALSFDGGGLTPSGPRVGGVDGKGGMPAIVHPDEAIIDLTKSQSRGMEGGAGKVEVNFHQTFTGGVTQTDLARQLEVQKRETISAVGLAVERGGSFRRQIRG